MAFFPNKSLTPGRCRKSRASAELHRVGAGSRTQQGARYVRRCARNAQVTAALYREGSRILDHARHCAGTDCRTEPQQPVSNEPALHTAYFKLMAWNCSFHALARQSRCCESQEFRGVDFGTAHQQLIGWSPPSPNGFGAAGFACFATIGLSVACLAVACEASEGWWARQGSNL